MATEKQKLKDLRDRIDTIDDSIQDLIIERTRIVEEVHEVKERVGSTVKIRPAREAEIFYRLMSRYKGPFPKRELARIWRELIVATLGFEGPFSAAVLFSEDEQGYWDIARDHFGSFTQMTRFGSARRVVEAVQSGEATIGVVPLPSHDESENWWRFLISDCEGTPRVIGRLPFIGVGNARDAGTEALVICPIDQEETGRDRSFLAIEAEEDIGYQRIESALTQAGFSVSFNQLWHDPERPPGWTYLVELFGFIEPGSRQMKRLFDGLGRGVTRIIHVGGYATPLSDQDLATSEEAE